MGSEKLVHSTKRDDYMTPESIILQLDSAFGRIDLDPCPALNHDLHFARQNACQCHGNDGLAVAWRGNGGLVYFNPPYGGRSGVINAWIDKAAREARLGAEIVNLVPAATGAQWFKRIWRTANAGCFVEGRLVFRDPATGGPILGKIGKPQTATFWSFLGYWGARRGLFFEAFSGLGECARFNAREGAAQDADGDGALSGKRNGQRSTKAFSRSSVV